MKTAEIAVIIDWEISGRFPEYWEYTQGHTLCLPRFGRTMAGGS